MPNTLVRDWLQDLLHDKRHPDFRTSLACIMVVFATLGAIMAFRTASAEHDNTIRERRLAYGYFFETIERQKELNGILERALFETRLSRIYQTGLSKMETADRLRQAKPATAAWLDLQAQEEFAARRAVKPFWALTPSMQNCLSVANHLQWTVAPLLSELGFETEWQDPRPAIDLPPDSADCKFAERKEPTRSILHLLEGEIQRGHELIPKLAMSVVLFVAALVCFTLADLSTRKWYKGIWLAGGLLVGAVCLFYALQADQRSWPFLALAVGSFLLLFSVMWNVGYLSTSEEGGHQSPLLEPETRIGRYPELPHEASDSFSRFTIFAIAFTVFASALSGYWYSVAESASGEAATRALRQETFMSERSSRLRTALLSANSQSADYSEAQARHSWINQQLDASGATPLIDIEIASAGNLRGYLLGNDKLRAMMSDPEAGIEADPHFPRRLVREDPYFALKDGVLKNNAWEPFAIWDAESGESLSWHHKAAVFLFTLTLFAIALYLFGQGHSMGRRSAAYIMVGFGTLFALIGLGRGSYAQFGNEVSDNSSLDSTAIADECRFSAERFGPEPELPQERAARHFAIAKVLLNIAGDSERYEEARDHLRCVVKMRPDFSAAYEALATAETRAGSVEIRSSYLSLPKRENVEAIAAAKRAALEKFHEKGFKRPPKLLMTYAFVNLLDALRRRDTSALKVSVQAREVIRRARALLIAKALRTSVDAARQALRSAQDAGGTYRSSLSWFQFNLGLISLANGDARAARQYYEDAFKGSQPEPDLIASAITDLETLVGSCKHDQEPEQCARPVNELIDQLAASLARAGAAGKPITPEKNVVLDGLNISATPGNFHARLRLRGFDRDKDKLAILWYARVPGWNSWRVLQNISGPIPAEELQSEIDGWLSLRRSPLLETYECLDSGQYRADIYVNGERVGRSEPFAQPIADFEASKFLKLNLSFCQPRGWLRLPWSEVDPKYRDYELINELFTRNPGAMPAAFFFTYYAPRLTTTAKAPLSELPYIDKSLVSLEKALVGLRENKGLIAREESVFHYTPPLAHRSHWSFVTRDEIYPPVAPYTSPEACADQIARGSHVYRSWTTTEGTVHVVIMLATSGQSGEQLCNVLESVNYYYKPIKAAAKN